MFRNLEAEIKRAGMTAGELAEATGIPAGSLSMKMNGHRPFSLKQAMAIKQALGTELAIEELFKITED